MTRADINVVLPSGKVMHWYKNGDQYPDGINRWFALDILLHDLACAFRWNTEEGVAFTEKEIREAIEAWYNFAYTPRYRYAGGVSPIGTKHFSVVDARTDWAYVIDFKGKKFAVYNWAKPVFSVSQEELGEPEQFGPMSSQNSWLYKAYDWLIAFTETADNRIWVKVGEKSTVMQRSAINANS